MFAMLKSLGFTFLLAVFPSYGERLPLQNDSGKRILLAKAASSKKTRKRIQKAASISKGDDLQAKGIILKFHHWPDEKEKTIIFNHLKKSGLKKTSELQRFKVWTFEWSKLKTKTTAKKICENFPSISSLKYCEPDYTLSPARKQETTNHEGTEYIMLRNWVNNRGLSIVSAIHFLERKNIPILYVDNPEVPALIAAGKSYSPTVHAIANTESNRSLLEEFSKGKIHNTKSQPERKTAATPNPDPIPQLDTVTNPQPTSTSQQNTGKNLKDCKILSSNAGFFDGKLSDYWAQEMIGADLLREELNQAPLPKKHLVEVFDSPEDEHGLKVRNLISDHGKNAVLPELGDNAGLTHITYTSDMLREADRLLDNVDSVCATKQTSESDSQKSSRQMAAQQQENTPGDSSKNPRQNQEDTSDSSTRTTSDTIILKDWAEENNVDFARLIIFLSRNNTPMPEIDNPYREALVAAGESYSPTLRTVSNTYQNKLNEFKQSQAWVTYSRDIKVIWKTATDWSTAWKASTEGNTPSSHYDLTATYEADRDKTMWLITSRKYEYIFRPPVLDMRGATKTTTELFNWLPLIVLAPGNKIKVWGTKVIGEGPLTINGVAVSFTLVPGTISDVTGSNRNHGRWEATLSSSNYNAILSGGQE